MTEYENDRSNTSQNRSGMSFRGVVYLLEVEFFVVVKIILKSVLIALELITLLAEIGSCITNLPSLLELLICLVVLDHLRHMTNTLGTFTDEPDFIKISV